jgi:acyl-CoA dehydrogenase
VPALNHIDGDLKKTLQSFSESRTVRGRLRLGASRAAQDYTWEQLNRRGIAPDYNALPAARPAAFARLLALEAEWEAIWLTVVRAKWIEQREGPGKIESFMAKAMGGLLARRVTQFCIEILGASGLSSSAPPKKLFRDARIFDIYEGTGEIQRLIIARHRLGYSKELN